MVSRFELVNTKTNRRTTGKIEKRIESNTPTRLHSLPESKRRIEIVRERSF